MDDKQFSILVDKIDKLSRVLVIQAVKDITKEQEKIELLDSIGFKPSEIAKLLGKSPANVSVVLGNLRKKRETPTTKGDSPPPQNQPPHGEAKTSNTNPEDVV